MKIDIATFYEIATAAALYVWVYAANPRTFCRKRLIGKKKKSERPLISLPGVKRVKQQKRIGKIKQEKLGSD